MKQLDYCVYDNHMPIMLSDKKYKKSFVASLKKKNTPLP